MNVPGLIACVALTTLMLATPARGAEPARALLVIAPRNYLESEYENTRHALEDAGVQVEVASVQPGTATGYAGGAVRADLAIDQADPARYDAVAVIGGYGAREHLWQHAGLHALLRAVHARKRVVAALCAAPPVLARAGLLAGQPATMWPDRSWIAELEAGGGRYVDAPIVSAGRILTGRDPAAATAFGKRLAELIGTAAQPGAPDR
ncbi:MAG: DJ-1/PfpI family protein [Candidatus Dactylopiibacterium sp.]|nr:DJ-1/PfpI family protein [Candidatus Dactylopiibacterium sp.]